MKMNNHSPLGRSTPARADIPASQPDISNLSRRARSYAGQAGLGTRSGILIYMTNDSEICDIPALTRRLEQLETGTLVIFRYYNASERRLISKRVCDICKRLGLPFLLAGDPKLARAIKADGLHGPRWLLPRQGLWQGFDGILTASCHNPSEIRQARLGGADFGLISPVWKTPSHPDTEPLLVRGLHGLAKVARAPMGPPLPIVALGGLSATNTQRLMVKPLIGFAGISVFHNPA